MTTVIAPRNGAGYEDNMREALHDDPVGVPAEYGDSLLSGEPQCPNCYPHMYTVGQLAACRIVFRGEHGDVTDDRLMYQCVGCARKDAAMYAAGRRLVPHMPDGMRPIVQQRGTHSWVDAQEPRMYLGLDGIVRPWP